jgi:hypothetical protein
VVIKFTPPVAIAVAGGSRGRELGDIKNPTRVIVTPFLVVPAARCSWQPTVRGGNTLGVSEHGESGG